jgi:hypothetical protein
VRTVTTTQYQVAMAYYEQRLKRQVKDDAPDGTTAPALPVPEDASDTTAVMRESTDGPFVSLSAPNPDAARERLRQEAIGWNLPAAQVDHILKHHQDVSKARALLWRARRPTGTMLTASAAD